MCAARDDGLPGAATQPRSVLVEACPRPFSAGPVRKYGARTAASVGRAFFACERCGVPWYGVLHRWFGDDPRGGWTQRLFCAAPSSGPRPALAVETTTSEIIDLALGLASARARREDGA
jgi:hypothetical protein